MWKLIGDAGSIFYASATSSRLAVLILWDILRLTPDEQWRSFFGKRQHGLFRIFIFAEVSGHNLLEPIAVT
jgi:hypothetical protein